MNESKCDACLFRQVCTPRVVCKEYTPIDEEESLDTYIEERRLEYYAEWRAYVPDEFE